MRPPPVRRGVRLGLASSAAALGVAACSDLTPKLPDGRIYVTGSQVKPPVAQTHWLTTDETPVRTELYPYSELDGERRNYIVSGPPIAFVFPKSAYAALENMEGGPQLTIKLRLDSETMEPIGSLIGRWRDRPRGDLYKAYYARYRSRDASIYIDSNYFAGAIAARERSFDKSNYLSEVAGTACGFALKRSMLATDARPLPRPPLIVDGFDLNSWSLQGRAMTAGRPSRVIECSQSSRVCIVSFGAAHAVVSYSIPKKRLCEHRRWTERIRDTLVRHQVL